VQGADKGLQDMQPGADEALAEEASAEEALGEDKEATYALDSQKHDPKVTRAASRVARGSCM